MTRDLLAYLISLSFLMIEIDDENARYSSNMIYVRLHPIGQSHFLSCHVYAWK